MSSGQDDYRARYDTLLKQAITALTEAGRLRWTVTNIDRGTTTGPADWAEFVSLAVAGAAANLGGIDAALAARPGSWEASIVRQLLTGTAGENEEHLWAHRTEPVVVEVYVDEILTLGGTTDLYDEAADEVDERYAAAETEEQARAVGLLASRLETMRQADWVAYGEALKARIEAVIPEVMPGLAVPVEVKVDVVTNRGPAVISDDFFDHSLEKRLISQALMEVLPPEPPMPRLKGQA